MFALRRIAVRASQCQPTRQLSSLRYTSLTSRIEAVKPSLYRSFHQSQRWLAEEGQKAFESPAEQQGGETVTAEPSAAEQKELKEESIATPEVADGAKDQAASTEGAAQEAAQAVKKATDSAKDALSGVTGKVSSAISISDRAPHFPPNDTSTVAQPTKILYLGNLFFEATAAHVEAEFGRIGQVVNSRIVTDSNGRSKGFGYVEFSSQEEADRAVREMDQKVFLGRRMAVQYHVRRDGRTIQRVDRRFNPPSKTLFIGNMSYQMSDRDLNDLFREIKNVLDVRVAIDRRSGQPRGFAHADFIDVASAEQAKNYLSKKVVYGRPLRVDFSASSSNESSSSSS